MPRLQFGIFNVVKRSLYDIRDNKPYTVRKLADGNCWMVDSLAFELEPNKTYTGVVNATGAEITFNTGTACSTNGNCIMNGNTLYDSTTGQWYYSWYAATAGSGTSSQVNADSVYSICPKGWRLPANYTIAPAKSYGSMTNAFGLTVNAATNTTNHIAQFEAFPLNFTRAGQTVNGGINGSGSNGRYWTSTAYTKAEDAYHLSYNASYTIPQRNDWEVYGMPIRCVVF